VRHLECDYVAEAEDLRCVDRKGLEF
jgi:hypothetical protein